MAPETPKKPGTIAVVILTRDEEANIAHALESARGFADELFVLDSHSTDRTAEIARSLGAHVATHRFENYGAQRNHALDALPITSEWVFFLDADEWLPDDLKAELRDKASRGVPENGFWVRFRFLWMGKWIRRGYYGTQVLRFFRHGKARCEPRSVNEHLVVDGAVGVLDHDFVHEDRKPIDRWVQKHSRYALGEAEEIFRKGPDDVRAQIGGKLFGSRAQRVRWIRHEVWDRLPPLVRPFLYFFWRYVLRGGVLDGPEAFVYHFLQALWFPLLTDVYYLELRRRRAPPGRAP